MQALSITVGLIFLLAGCAHKSLTTDTASAESRTQLSKVEIARCEQVAWDAVNSAEMLERFRPERITTEPFEFSNKGIQCYLDQETFETVEVAVPSGGQFSFHGCYLGVTLKRDSYEILSMRENAWP